MGFFDKIERAIENYEIRQEIREEQRELWLAHEAWEMEGQYFDPYMHGDMMFDPYLGHHGVMYNGMWHPLDYYGGNWVFAHPARFNVPRYYVPQNMQPPQAPYGQSPMQGGYNQGPGQPQGGYGQQRPPQGQGAGFCSNCGSPLAAGARFCSSCGHQRG